MCSLIKRFSSELAHCFACFFYSSLEFILYSREIQERVFSILWMPLSADIFCQVLQAFKVKALPNHWFGWSFWLLNFLLNCLCHCCVSAFNSRLPELSENSYEPFRKF